MSSELGNTPPLSASNSIQSIGKPSRGGERNQAKQGKDTSDSKSKKSPKEREDSNSPQHDTSHPDNNLQEDAFEASEGGAVIKSSEETDENAPKKKKGQHVDVKI
ncbi:MAG: hypothetical protein K9N34_00915 [Candidatus Marinimicrobia bacterium]|nr:hypothetical protein [Candidatus Neomarinimicrobiota bacterium]MCF7841138.1 hypothetical protein [Candidatus Neomarinimicrobiota bacterium]MCF7902398.1 hypothetical protein [Candidatus Neomarinimicrobiota bacterium]